MARRKGGYKSHATEAMETILSKQMKPFLDELADKAVREFKWFAPVLTGDLEMSPNWVRGKKNPLSRFLRANFYWRFVSDGTITIQATHFVDRAKRAVNAMSEEILKKFPI